MIESNVSQTGVLKAWSDYSCVLGSNMIQSTQVVIFPGVRYDYSEFLT